MGLIGNRYTESRTAVTIPDELAGQIGSTVDEVAQFALEAVALEGYRRDLLSEADLRESLGFETRMEVHGFLKNHGVYLQYSVDDLASDRAVALEVAQRARGELQRDPTATQHV